MNDPGVNPFNLPNPAPGMIAPVDMASFDLMEEWEECDDPHEGTDDAVEASEDNFDFNLNA